MKVCRDFHFINNHNGHVLICLIRLIGYNGQQNQNVENLYLRHNLKKLTCLEYSHAVQNISGMDLYLRHNLKKLTCLEYSHAVQNTSGMVLSKKTEIVCSYKRDIHFCDEKFDKLNTIYHYIVWRVVCSYWNLYP